MSFSCHFLQAKISEKREIILKKVRKSVHKLYLLKVHLQAILILFF